MRTRGPLKLAQCSLLLSVLLVCALVSSLLNSTVVPAPATAAPYPGPAGAREVRGEIERAWQRVGGARGVLGAPLSEELGTPDARGRSTHFQGGSIYWTPATGAHEVHGAIAQHWSALGWERSVLGYPISDELAVGDGLGRVSHFEHGSIYWSPATGAHEVHGANRQRWLEMGAQRSHLGYPVGDEVRIEAGQGRYAQVSRFQHGELVWWPDTSPAMVRGAVFEAVRASSWPLVLPFGDEMPTEDGVGRWQPFVGGSVFWHPRTGAHVLPGPISFQHVSSSGLGYPVAEHVAVQRFADTWLVQRFENGSRYVRADSGGIPYVVWGQIHSRYLQLGAEGGALGWPTSDELPSFWGPMSSGGRENWFENGTIYWSEQLGAHAVLEPFESWSGPSAPTRGLPVGEQHVSADSTWQVFETVTLVRSVRDGRIRESTGVHHDCTALWDAVEAPLRRGAHGYSPALDADGDGVACPVDPRHG
ncbi:hypothetical protein GCM10027586_01230 [Kineococcus gypseus]|uniref:excalibur calcium-binding domain-containing protein n=1 Tax=Kineococcus gypseus TaxID=1637102 RepID=UPI003D7CD4A9